MRTDSRAHGDAGADARAYGHGSGRRAHTDFYVDGRTDRDSNPGTIAHDDLDACADGDGDRDTRAYGDAHVHVVPDPCPYGDPRAHGDAYTVANAYTTALAYAAAIADQAACADRYADAGARAGNHGLARRIL